MTRICSLLPSATEIVAELGLTGALVGVSEECDWPPEVRGLPVVTASRIDTRALTSLEVDRAVRAAVTDGRSLYALDGELIERLEPDLIVTQDLCAVCAVSSSEVDRLCSVEAEQLSLDPRTIEEIGASVLLLASRLGVEERGRAVVEAMWGRIERAAAAVAGRRRPRVFVSEWLEPPFAAGHWLPEMVAFAGGEDVLGRAGEPSFQTSWADVAGRAPELIVLASCGYDAGRIAGEAAEMRFPAPAVAVDANAYFSRPAPRVARGVEQLGFLLHPDAVPDPGLPLIELGVRVT